MKTLNLIENAMPKLETAINNMLKTNFDLGLKVTESLNRRNEVIYTIESGELKSLTGPIGEMTYESFVFATWGGQKVMDENKIWFNPKFFSSIRMVVLMVQMHFGTHYGSIWTLTIGYLAEILTSNKTHFLTI